MHARRAAEVQSDFEERAVWFGGAGTIPRGRDLARDAGRVELNEARQPARLVGGDQGGS